MNLNKVIAAPFVGPGQFLILIWWILFSTLLPLHSNDTVHRANVWLLIVPSCPVIPSREPFRWKVGRRMRPLVNAPSHLLLPFKISSSFKSMIPC